MSKEDLKVLERARQLALAANSVAEQLNQQAADYKNTIESRRQREEEHRLLELQVDNKKKEERALSSKDIGKTKELKGAAIAGSSLLTTFDDIRQYTSRGSVIEIDGTKYQIAENGEWSGNRVELKEDFKGKTNFEAVIVVTVNEHAVAVAKKFAPKKPAILPIPGDKIAEAVVNLNTISYSPPKPAASVKPIPPPGAVINASSRLPRRTKSREKQVTFQHQQQNDDSQSISPVSPHKILEEMSTISSQDQQLRRNDMNKRMAERGRVKAMERIEQHNMFNSHLHQQLNPNVDNQNSYSNKTHFKTEDELEEERLRALERVARKAREDEEAVRIQLAEEAANRKEKQRLMAEKAKLLQEKTLERVQAYKSSVKQQQELERQQKEAEEEARRQREQAMRDEAVLRRIKERLKETEDRLHRRQQEEEARKQLEEEERQRKLKELEQQRGRNVATVAAAGLHHARVSSASSVNSAQSSKFVSPEYLALKPSIDKTRSPKKSKNTKKQGIEEPEERKADVVVEVPVTVGREDKVGKKNKTLPSRLKLPDIRESRSEQASRNTNSTSIFINRSKTNLEKPSKEIIKSATKQHQKNSTTELPNSHTQEELSNNINSKVETIPRNIVDDEDIDDWSDDSLKNYKATRPPQHPKPSLPSSNIHHHPPQHSNQSYEFDSYSIVSALTNDTSFASEGEGCDQDGTVNGSTTLSKKTKRSRPVWKMKPIPIPTYTPVPSSTEQIT